jgi:hypothetical protein
MKNFPVTLKNICMACEEIYSRVLFLKYNVVAQQILMQQTPVFEEQHSTFTYTGMMVVVVTVVKHWS